MHVEEYDPLNSSDGSSSEEEAPQKKKKKKRKMDSNPALHSRYIFIISCWNCWIMLITFNLVPFNYFFLKFVNCRVCEEQGVVGEGSSHQNPSTSSDSLSGEEEAPQKRREVGPLVLI